MYASSNYTKVWLGKEILSTLAKKMQFFFPPKLNTKNFSLNVAFWFGKKKKKKPTHQNSHLKKILFHPEIQAAEYKQWMSSLEKGGKKSEMT